MSILPWCQAGSLEGDFEATVNSGDNQGIRREGLGIHGLSQEPLRDLRLQGDPEPGFSLRDQYTYPVQHSYKVSVSRAPLWGPPS